MSKFAVMQFIYNKWTPKPMGNRPNNDNPLRIVDFKLERCVNAFLEFPFVYHRKDDKLERSSSSKENPGKIVDISLYKIRHKRCRKTSMSDT